MKRFLIPGLIAVLLIACIAGMLATRGAGSDPVAEKIHRKSTTALIDDRLLRTAHALATIADSDDGQALAKEATRLSGHELDIAFATALREALSAPPPANGPLKELADRIVRLKTHIAAEQTEIDRLSKQAATNQDASDQLEVAKAQLELDQDELADAQQDLARQGGDKHALLEQEQQEYEAVQKESVQFPKTATKPSTLYERISEWVQLGNRAAQVSSARDQGLAKAATLEHEHQALEKLMNGHSTGATATQAGDDEDISDVVARLSRLSNQRKTLAEMDRRIQDVQRLADVYKRWQDLLQSRRTAALHRVLVSLAAIMVVILAVVLLDLAIRLNFANSVDRRKRRQLRVISTLTVQVIGLVIVILIMFGLPTQTSTLIGLATAGVTVVMRDFIVAFFGWFVLMGKNGIHVGDWVEIEGVGGEVIEIGLLRTMLLEVGNWTDRGHPTGRHVAFVNKFAIEGHYFNFSTADQWLWDELVISLPASGDPYALAQQILETVLRHTENDATLAEQDWRRATSQYGTRPFSAKPAVDLRPSPTGLGLEVHVRYITRAPQRYEVKSQLFEAIVELLHKATSATA